MSYAVTIATTAERDLIVDALRQAAAQRIRVATKGAGLVRADKLAKRDVRASSVRVAMVLAEADTLGALADDLEAATEGSPSARLLDDRVTKVDEEALAAHVAAIPFPDAAAATADDGTSPEAQLIARLAGLTPDLPEDPLSGATAEDELDLDPADVNLGGTA